MQGKLSERLTLRTLAKRALREERERERREQIRIELEAMRKVKRHLSLALLLFFCVIVSFPLSFSASSRALPSPQLVFCKGKARH